MKLVTCEECSREVRIFNEDGNCPFCYRKLNSKVKRTEQLSASELLLNYYTKGRIEQKKYPIKDFDLGVRHNTDKYKMSLIPPQFLEGLAKVLTDGEKKYGKENLTKGNYVSVPYDSAIRHLHSFMKGENLDSESGSHHLFHAAANLMMMYLYHTKPELDDRSFKDEEK